MKVEEIYKGLFLYSFPNQFELCHTFFRLQEFYESPIKQIRNKYFTYEDAITYYAYDQKEEPFFTYFEDWNGFNVPGNVVDKFIDLFADRMTDKEITLLDLFFTKNRGKYYIIGAVEGEEDTMKHEVAHGLYYLNKKYKRDMNKLIKALPNRIKEKIKENLLSIGYCKQVVKDETQAYLSTGIREGMLNIFDKIIYWKLLKQFKATFEKYYTGIKYESHS